MELGKNIDDGLNFGIKHFLDSVHNYMESQSATKKLKDIIQDGLEVFNSIENTISCSIFLVNQNTFDFELKITLPAHYGPTIEKSFDKMINSGLIGKALNSIDVILKRKNDSPEFSFDSLIIPLVSTNGIIGLVINTFDEFRIRNEENFFRSCALFGGYFAGSIRNSLLNKKLSNTKDILEQKVAARTMDLVQNKRELDTIFNSVHTGILVIDAETDKILKANPVSLSIIGIEGKDISGMNYLEFLDYTDSDLPESDEEFPYAMNFESELRTIDDRIIPILRTTSLIKVGTISYRIESFLDISERKKAELALKDANELLELKVQERTEELQVLVHTLKEQIAVRERAENEILKMLKREKVLNELKTGFVSMVSHEFRTPLTIIRTSAQIIEKFDKKLTGSEKSEYLQRIMKTVDFMKDLIENAIFIGQTDSDKVKLKPSKINIRDYCQQLISDLKLSMDNDRQINYSYKGLEDKIFTDPKILRNIVVNLLTNAIKYSAENTPVEFYLDCDETVSNFTIKDYGIGIAEHEQEKIFELFYRGENVGKISGTGLGMSVVLRSLEALDGNIDLSSRPGAGTTFKVRLPHLQRIENKS